MNNKNVMDKINAVLGLVGLITACIMSVAYLICVVVLIVGFEKKDILQTTIFAVVSALIGLLILASWRYQGQSWAAALEENKKVLKQYGNETIKNKKRHSMGWFWTWATLKDIFFKAVGISASTIGVIYLVVVGSKDYTMLYTAVVNLLMWICWGLKACAIAYNYYNNEYIPYIKERIKESNPNAVFEEVKQEGFIEKAINKLERKGDQKND